MQPNTTGAQRSATVQVAGVNVVLTQTGVVCSVAVGTSTAYFGPHAGIGNANVTAPAGCPWTLSSNVAWLVVTGTASGSGNGTVQFSVAAQSSFDARSATLGVAGESVTINQSGDPTLDPSTLVVRDSFTATQEVFLASHYPEVNRFGQPWINYGPETVVRTGAATPFAAESSSFASVALIDSYVSDGVVSADWRPAPSAATAYGYPIGGLVFRAVDEGNYYVVGYGVTGGTDLALGVVVAGNFEVIQQVSAPIPAPGHTPRLEVRMSGSAIAVLVDGVLQLVASHATWAHGTRHGFRWWSAYDAASGFDNFTVRGPSLSAVHHVEISPASPVMAIQNYKTLTAVAYDVNNNVVPGIVFSWNSSNPSNATIMQTGANTARAESLAYGPTTITASAGGGVSQTAVLTVAPVASVRIHSSSPDPNCHLSRPQCWAARDRTSI